VGRTWIEFFRPDQPKIDGLGISYSMVFASLMAITGILLLLVRYKIFNFSIAEDWEEEYHISGQTEPVEKIVEAEVLDGEVPDVKKTAGKAKKAASDKSVKKSTVRKKPTTATAKKTLSKPATKSKKSS
jgi:hypothetical protein